MLQGYSHALLLAAERNLFKPVPLDPCGAEARRLRSLDPDAALAAAEAVLEGWPVTAEPLPPVRADEPPVLRFSCFAQSASLAAWPVAIWA